MQDDCYPIAPELQFKVKEHHIILGQPRDGDKCALALAINDNPKCIKAEVCDDHISFKHKEYGPVSVEFLDKTISRFIAYHDQTPNKKRVKPGTLTITERTGEAHFEENL